MSNLDANGDANAGAYIGRVADEIFKLAVKTGMTVSIDFNGTMLEARPEDANASEALRRWVELRGDVE